MGSRSRSTLRRRAAAAKLRVREQRTAVPDQPEDIAEQPREYASPACYAHEFAEESVPQLEDTVLQSGERHLQPRGRKSTKRRSRGSKKPG